jgi:hypothetical protein
MLKCGINALFLGLIILKIWKNHNLAYIENIEILRQKHNFESVQNASKLIVWPKTWINMFIRSWALIKTTYEYIFLGLIILKNWSKFEKKHNLLFIKNIQIIRQMHNFESVQHASKLIVWPKTWIDMFIRSWALIKTTYLYIFLGLIILKNWSKFEKKHNLLYIKNIQIIRQMHNFESVQNASQLIVWPNTWVNMFIRSWALIKTTYWYIFLGLIILKNWSKFEKNHNLVYIKNIRIIRQEHNFEIVQNASQIIVWPKTWIDMFIRSWALIKTTY